MPLTNKKNSPDLAIGAGDQNRSIRQRMPVWTGEFSESVQVGLSGFPGQANNSQPESMWLNLNTRLAMSPGCITEFLSNVYRTLIKHPSNVDRNFIERIPNTARQLRQPKTVCPRSKSDRNLVGKHSLSTENPSVSPAHLAKLSASQPLRRHFVGLRNGAHLSRSSSLNGSLNSSLNSSDSDFLHPSKNTD